MVLDLSPCPSWEVVFQSVPLVGKGKEDCPQERNLEWEGRIWEAAAYPRRATPDPSGLSCKLEGASSSRQAGHAPGVFHEQSKGSVSATMCPFIQVQQRLEHYTGCPSPGFLLAPITTPPHTQLAAGSSEHKPPNPTQQSFTLGGPECSSPLPCFVSLCPCT